MKCMTYNILNDRMMIDDDDNYFFVFQDKKIEKKKFQTPFLVLDSLFVNILSGDLFKYKMHTT